VIKLGLSGRLIEAPDGYQMPTTDFIRFAAEIGYQCVELRPRGQVTPQTTEAEVAAIRAALDAAGLVCAFVTFGEPQTDDSKPAFGRMCEITVGVGCPSIRVGVKEIPWVQWACDVAAEHGLNLVSQIHTGTPLETVEGALETCAHLARENFGVAYEPGNFVLVGRDYGLAALQQLGDKLLSVSLQNIKPVPELEGPGVIAYGGRGFRRCRIGDPEGVDFEEVFEALHAVGYDGYATVIEPISEVMDNLELARFAFDKLSPLCA